MPRAGKDINTAKKLNLEQATTKHDSDATGPSVAYFPAGILLRMHTHTMVRRISLYNIRFRHKSARR